MQKQSLFKKITSSREVSLLIVLIILLVAVTIKSPDFFTAKNIMEILKNNAFIMIMVLGMLCVLLIGGIDISITSTLAFAGMTIGMMYKNGQLQSTFLGFLIATGMGVACGFMIGIVIAYGRVAPIIATMGFMYIYRGFAYLVANEQWAGAEALGTFKDFALKDFLGINVIIWIVIVCYVIFFIVMKWTKFGRNIYAVGSNTEAAQISGINVGLVKTAVYTIMGALAGFSGAVSVSVYASGQPNMQMGKEMDVIAACVIGGVSMSGGSGTVLGALLGALVISVINKALPLMGIPNIAQNMIKGVLIVAVIILNVLAQRTMNRANLEKREM
ncbi:MAG: ABC transporter permease [Eubacterium sp.]|nr:ABC transporter permease [Eubacterium sp.]